MNTPSRDDLLGYVLGALEPHECEQIEASLLSRPDLQLELQRIKARLAPMENCRQPVGQFPVGLARRTCEIVARTSHAATHGAEFAKPNADSIDIPGSLAPCFIGRGPAEGPSATISPLEAERRNSEDDRNLGTVVPAAVPSSTLKISPPSSGAQPHAARRSLQSATLLCCAAFCGALVGPMLARFAPGALDPIVVVPAAAVAQLERDFPSFAPMPAANPTQFTSWPSDSIREGLLNTGTRTSMVQRPMFFDQSVSNGVIDVGLRKLASGPSPFTQLSRPDAWDDGPVIQFITE